MTIPASCSVIKNVDPFGAFHPGQIHSTISERISDQCFESAGEFLNRLPKGNGYASHKPINGQPDKKRGEAP